MGAIVLDYWNKLVQKIDFHGKRAAFVWIMPCWMSKLKSGPLIDMGVMTAKTRLQK